MVVNRGDIKRKRKDDSCMSMLDDSPKRTKVHAQRKFAQGSNVSSPVITPVKEIERQERHKDVLPEPIELSPAKRPNTEDFLTFLCFRGTPILPPNLNFFNTASMIDSRSQTEEPKTFYPQNGPILTSTATKSQSERPFIAFGVRKRADPVVISKQMDRKRRHALALQALRRKYQEQKMAKIRAVTISKLSEKVTSKNIVRTRSIAKHETTTKKPVTHKTNIKVIATKHISSKTVIKQPLKSKMCLRSFQGRYIHRELNVKTHRKRSRVGRRPVKLCSVNTIENEEKSSSEFSSDDDEPLMKSLKPKETKKNSTIPAKKPTSAARKPDVNNSRLTRSHNKLTTQPQRKQSQTHRRVFTRLPSLRSRGTRVKNKKIVQTSNIRNVKMTVNSMKRPKTQQVTKFVRSTRQQILKEKLLSLDVKRTRSRSSRCSNNKKEENDNKEHAEKNLKASQESKRNDKPNTKINDVKSVISKESNEKSNIKAEIRDIKDKTIAKLDSTDKKQKLNVKSEINDKKANVKLEVNDKKEKQNVKLEVNNKKEKPNIKLDVMDKTEKPNMKLDVMAESKKPNIKIDVLAKIENPTIKLDVVAKPEKPTIKLDTMNKNEKTNIKVDVMDKNVKLQGNDKKEKPNANLEVNDKKEKPNAKLEMNDKKENSNPKMEVIDKREKPNVKLEMKEKPNTELQENDIKETPIVQLELKEKSSAKLEVNDRKRKSNLKLEMTETPNIKFEVNDKKENLNIKSEINENKETPNIKLEVNEKKEKANMKSEINEKKAKPNKKLEMDDKKEMSNAKLEMNDKKEKPNVRSEINDKKENSNEKLGVNNKKEKLNLKSEMNDKKEKSNEKLEVNNKNEKLNVKTEINDKKEKPHEKLVVNDKTEKLNVKSEMNDKKENLHEKLEENDKKEKLNVKSDINDKNETPNVNSEANVKKEKPNAKVDVNHTKENPITKLGVIDKIDKLNIDMDENYIQKSNIKLETNIKNENSNIKLDKIVRKSDKLKIEPKAKIPKRSDPNEKISNNIKESVFNVKDDTKKNKSSCTSVKVENTVADEKIQISHIKDKEMEESYKSNTQKNTDKISNLRPTRKTKEAAAIYMELLGHRLVNDTEIDDDDVSIDSFPELPNVRRTEQRENELKAKAKSKTTNTKNVCKKKNDNKNATIANKCEKSPQQTNSKIQNKKSPANNTPNNNDQKPALLTKEKNNINMPIDSDTQILTVKSEESFDERDKCKIYKQLNINSKDNPSSPIVNAVLIKKRSENLAVNVNRSKNSNLNKSHDDNKPKIDKNKELSKDTVKKTELDQSFSDSDEEPLSNLKKSKKIKKRHCKNAYTENLQVAKETNLKTTKSSTEKPKRECTKKSQSYFPFSSDDEEKYFHGFLKSELKTNPEVCPHSLPSDLSCKDLSRRYGKGKVNMSNEQIEKWLNDSAMAVNIKKEEDEILKFEKISPVETNMQETINPPLKSTVNKKLDEKKIKNANRENEDIMSTSSTPEKTSVKPPIKSTSNERKTIFKKEKTEPVRNVNAFSVSNECSVYAFEADNEDSINTPFRRPSRRPSSTTTSKSEDETKVDDISKHSAKFRLPTMLRNDIKLLNKQEFPHGTDESNINVGVQVNIENQIFTDNSNSEAPSITEDTDHIFCASGQTNKSNPAEINVKPSTSKNENNQPRFFTKSRMCAHPALQKANERLMFPPTNTIQKGKVDNKSLQRHIFNSKNCDRNSETSEDTKYKIPSSPSASSSSSTKVYKRQTAKTRNRLHDFCTPVNATEFPSSESTPQIVEAPVFHPTEKEFQDPLEYIEKIRSRAEKFGICRIVPPITFKPECKVADDMRFTAYNQYINKMLHRWGPNFKELIVIRKYLETQNITLTHPPWIGGMEIDLPRLYQTVQSLGGLKEVIEKKKWAKVSEAMRIPKSAQDRVTKLDDIYCKYLLPYDTLSPAEREKLFDEVETEWAKRESKTLLNVQRSTKLDTSNTDVDSDSDNESEECIVKGRNIALNAFYRIARNTMSMWFKTVEPPAEEVEQEFWKHVTLKNHHICVHSGSIDSGNWGYGFAVSKNSPFARHAWNLKVLTNNSGSVLRSMGPIMGVTVPTLHVGMVFSACCWYRDPHRLPWVEYLHTGGHKIWYAIPDSMSKQFHATMLKLVPNYCRNKSVWLPSDTVMIPPKLLVENGVSLCRSVQEPGQFIVVFPKVFTSNVSTGYVVSESVYFAPLYWLQSAQTVFNELRENCEPSMFSIDRLLLSITSDTRSSIEVLKQIIPPIQDLCNRERILREKLRELGLTSTEKLPPPETPAVRKRKRLQQEGGDYECEICRTNLFISLVNEVQEDAVYCLEHVIEHIEQKKIDVINCKLLFTYDCEELDLLVDKIRSTIEIKQQKKIPVKVSLSLVK